MECETVVVLDIYKKKVLGKSAVSQIVWDLWLSLQVGNPAYNCTLQLQFYIQNTDAHLVFVHQMQ